MASTAFNKEAAYQDLEDYALRGSEARDVPRAVLIGGQPGAGKSELAYEAGREFLGQGGSITVDADQMRAANPDFKRLAIQDPQNASDRTQQEAGQWATRLTTAARESRRNLVVDGTMRNADNQRDLVTRLKETGYQVEVRILAVNPETSLARARLRYEQQVAEGGTGRYVNQEQHDRAYEGVRETVAALEQEARVDRIRVYDANQVRLYDNTQVNGTWERPPQASETLRTEQTRAWSHSERRDYVSTLEEINQLARERSGLPDPEIGARLNGARADLARIEHGDAFKRAEAFDRLMKSDALGRHPELDGAYAQLREVRKQFGAMSQHEREATYFEARAQLYDQLQEGAIPKGPVTVEESRQVIDYAARVQGLASVRDGRDVHGEVKGEVAGFSSHHVLVKVGDEVALRIERSTLDKPAERGQALVISRDMQLGVSHAREPMVPMQDMDKTSQRSMDRELGGQMGR